MITDLGDDASVVGLDREELVIALLHFVSGTRRDLAQPGPGKAVVLRLGHADPTLGLPQLLTDVEQAAVLELRRAVRAVDDRRDGRRPGLAAVGRTKHPLAELRLTFLSGQAILRGLPAGLAFRRLLGEQAALFVGQRREGRDEQGSLGGLHHAAVPIVDRAVEEHARIGPGRAIVFGSHRLHLPERADMAVAAAGPRDPEFAIGAARECRPAGIGLFRRGDGLRLEDLRGLGAERGCHEQRPETTETRTRGRIHASLLSRAPSARNLGFPLPWGLPPAVDRR